VTAADSPACSLPAALNAKQPEDDLCNVGDFVCDDEGHLQKIDFSNAGATQLTQQLQKLWHCQQDAAGAGARSSAS
jgi:hypothetical protein